MNEATGVYQFLSVGELAETVTQMLSLGLHYHTTISGTNESPQRSGIEQIEQLILQQARDYLAQVREGFALSVRTRQIHNRSELRYLLDQVLLDWNSIWDELGFTQEDTGRLSADASHFAPDTTTDTPAPEQIRHQLLAFGMAAVALGYLPRLPADKITFPHSFTKPATYSDIPAPQSPGALLSRIDELERMVGRLMGGNLQEIVNRRYGALRRTYGFFEVSAHLTRRDAERFGLKPKQSQFLL